jgi:gluconate kinase
VALGGTGSRTGNSSFERATEEESMRQRLGWFFDVADSLHSQANDATLRRGKQLERRRGNVP